MGKRKTKIVVSVAALALVLGLIAYGISRNRSTDTTPEAASSPTVVITTATTELDDAIPEGCPSNPEPIDEPVSMVLVDQDLEMPMISVGRDADGAAGAPPGDEGYTIAWWHEGPKVGSDKGKVVLSSHTFQFGGALGNDLNQALLEIGDVIKISDAEGKTACYRYSGNLHVLVDEYDPDSDILYDWEGQPQFGIVVCSDYTATGEALGRVIYYGDLISAESEPGPEKTTVGQAGQNQPRPTTVVTAR